MKIAILTLPFRSNYGGVLQNFALQFALKQMEYDSVTLNIKRKRSLLIYLCSWAKSFLLWFNPKTRRPFAKYSKKNAIEKDFIQSKINVTEPLTKLNVNVLKKNNIDCVIVGSDQIWRPKYSLKIYDAYLKFVKGLNIKRISYAASFGVEEWEYTLKQTKVCSALVKNFNAISVREESGVELCRAHLGVDAAWVLDPTLLLKKDDYLPLCSEVPVCSEKYLAVYVLDESEQVVKVYEKEANDRGLIVKKFYADAKSTLSIPEWLAMFRDASYVVTDSFHGTVFSIIFGKEFKCIYNKFRGTARFESLLNLYNLGKLEEMRAFSINWLKKALEN